MDFDEIFDVRDVKERLEELREEKGRLEDAVVEAQQDAEEAVDTSFDDEAAEAVEEAQQELQDFMADCEEELNMLEEFESQINNTSWEYGATVIPEGKFTAYAEEYAEDIHGVKTLEWPFDCVDWDKAAAALKMDFTSIEVGGETYYYRAGW